MTRKQSRAEADAAWHRMEQELLIRTQLDAFDAKAGHPPETPPPLADMSDKPTYPSECPRCSQYANRPGRWTHMSLEEPSLQCNQCGAVVRVSKAVWEMVREDCRAMFAERNERSPRMRRTRGAG